jgi:hypothetical protein
MAIQGERGTLVLPAEWLLRLRHNPFYSYLDARALAWIDSARGQRNDRAESSAPTGQGADPSH